MANEANETDSFFDLYKQNIPCYYNNKKILKIINDGITNIPPTVNEMLFVYETNSQKIQNFNKKTYLNHYKMVKTILCRLFTNTKCESEQLLFDNIKSNFDFSKNGFMKYITNITEMDIPKINNPIPKIDIPKIDITKIKNPFSFFDRNKKNPSEIEKKISKYFETVANEIFDGFDRFDGFDGYNNKSMKKYL